MIVKQPLLYILYPYRRDNKIYDEYFAIYGNDSQAIIFKYFVRLKFTNLVKRLSYSYFWINVRAIRD